MYKIRLKYFAIIVAVVVFGYSANYLILRHIGIIKHYRYIYESPLYDSRVIGPVELPNPTVSLDSYGGSYQDVCMFSQDVDKSKRYRILMHELSSIYFIQAGGENGLFRLYESVNKWLIRWRVYSPAVIAEEYLWSIVEPENGYVGI